MSERKWTKGEWKVTINPGVAYLPPSFIVVGPALVAKYSGHEDIAEANAHLIAAAPGMAEYIKRKADEGCQEAAFIWGQINGN